MGSLSEIEDSPYRYEGMWDVPDKATIHISSNNIHTSNASLSHNGWLMVRLQVTGSN